MTPLSRFVRWAALIGIALPVVLYPLWLTVNHYAPLGTQVAFEDMVIALWPSSFFLMALDGSSRWFVGGEFLAISVAANGLLYSFLGLLFWAIWQIYRRI